MNALATLLILVGVFTLCTLFPALAWWLIVILGVLFVWVLADAILLAAFMLLPRARRWFGGWSW